MNSETKSTLSNNNLRRMQGWARAVYPGDWQDRCAVVTEYLAQLDEDTAASLIKKGWPDVFAAAEREWPEALPAGNKSPPSRPDPRVPSSRDGEIHPPLRPTLAAVAAVILNPR